MSLEYRKRAGFRIRVEIIALSWFVLILLTPKATTDSTGVERMLPHATNPVAVWANHTSPEFVENLKAGLIPLETKLALKLNGRHTGWQSRESC